MKRKRMPYDVQRAGFRVIAKMTGEEALAVLEVFGSSDDPVYLHGEETSAALLSFYPSQGRGEPNLAGPAARVHIEYFTGSQRKKGTLADMVFDRMELRVRRK